MEPDGEAFDSETAWKNPPGMGRTILSGVAVGVIVSFAAVVGVVLADGQKLGAAVGLGLFIAVWGGLGFGAMVGGVVAVSRAEAAEEHHARA